MAHCEHHFKLNRPAKDGSTRREHLESASRQTGRAIQELAGPPCPRALRYLIGYFNDLHAARGGSGFGPSPIGYTDIDAYSRLTRRRLSPLEVDIIVRIDRAFLSVMAKPDD
ncbi:MAG: phage tail assembly chaperone [Gemmatimonadaceae bacterium]